MSESFVSFCHFMSIFLFLDSSACVVESVHQFASELFFHRTFAALTGIADSPADTEGQATVCTYFNRNLVVSTADTTSTDFQDRHNVVESLFKYFQRIFIHFRTDDVESIVNDGFSDTFFAVQHNFVDEARYQFGMVHRIRQHITLRNGAFSWHV